MRHLPLLLIGAVLLAGCTGTGIRPGVDDQRQWQLRGKLGLRAPGLAESAYLNWRQCGDDYQLRLSGPLGQTVARIDGRDGRVTLAVAGREPVATRDPEALLQQQLGWSVPIDALRHWVRAEPAPGSRAELEGPAAQPAKLRQGGWEVEYRAYHQSQRASDAAGEAGVALPARLQLRGEGDLQATLLINEWLLSDAVDCAAP